MGRAHSFLVVGCALAGALGCGVDETFRCQAHSQCANAGVVGRCEPVGYCSFPDDDCATGHAFGPLAGEGLAGHCVDPTDNANDSTAGSSPGTGTTDSRDDDADSQSATSANPADTGGVDSEEDGDADADADADAGSESDGSDTSAEGTTGGANTCGNGVLDPGEPCDGSPPRGVTCFDFGLWAGSLACGADCVVDTNGCTNPVCGSQAPPPRTACPAECDRCDAAAGCSIYCGAGGGGCDNVVCPDGWPCRVTCNGGSACLGAQVHCPDGFPCSVACDGGAACDNLQVLCAGDGPCGVQCGATSCDGAVVGCASGHCSATCRSPVDVFLSCGEACQCDNDCT